MTIGRSGLTYEQLRLRCKRWLLAGLDDDHWEDVEAMRDHHVGLGGTHLRDFTTGFSEERCDEIARGL